MKTIKERKIGLYTVKVGLGDEYYEAPNDIWGNWSEAKYHDAGTTVKDYKGGGHWINANYTVAELTQEYARAGRENPSKQAYNSLQRELMDDLYGSTPHLVVTIYHDILGELGFDSLGISLGMDEWATEEIIMPHVKENGMIGNAIAEAKKKRAEMAKALCV